MANNASDASKPIPQPRRTLAKIENPTKPYENVNIDLINKNIDVSDDNLQSNRKTKIQNKAFLLSTTANSPTNSSSVISNTTPNTTATTTAHRSNRNPDEYRNVMTEINNLNIDKNKNATQKNFEDSHKLNNLPVPAPRRTPPSGAALTQAEQDEIYENNEEVQTPPTKSSASSGAISKTSNIVRKAPQIPLPPPPTTTPERRKHPNMTASGVVVGDDTESMDGIPMKQHLNKSVSNTSINSSNSSGYDLSGGSSPKYITSSPGSLLKSLGATSKLLTESITERVAVRTKDAKHKIDKIQKSSREKLSETTKFASSRLKNVRNNIIHSKIGDNFSLGRSHEKKVISEYNLDRPQTLPPNDELFQSISFNSPLNTKAGNSYNLNNDESSYEVPRKSASSSKLGGAGQTEKLYPSLYKLRDENQLSSSDEADITSDHARGFERNTKVTQSMFTEKESSRPILSPKMKKGDASSSSSSDILSPEEKPCPNYPPPIHHRDREGVYGRLLKSNISSSTDSDTPIRAPIRSKRRKEYEETQIRMKTSEQIPQSNRATIDSNEYLTIPPVEDRIPRIFSRDVSSTDYGERIELEEKMISAPSRSESWAFYDVNNEDRDCASSPEPIYANDGTLPTATPEIVSESVYGVLYSTDTTSAEAPMLTPQSVERKRNSQRRLNPDVCPMTSDIIREFDPLILTTVDEICSNKSNELILLENLLGQDTYGEATAATATAEPLSGDNSSITPDISDDEDNSKKSEDLIIPHPPQRQDSLEPTTSRKAAATASPKNAEQRKTVIIHQNLKLRSDSMDDILNLEEVAVAPYLAKCEDDGASGSADGKSVDLSRPTPSRSHWFDNDDGETDAATIKQPVVPKQQITKKPEIDKVKSPPRVPIDEKSPPPGYAPPTYNEAIADTTVQYVEDKPKSSISLMISNVFTNIKRKPSFKGVVNQVTKNDVKTIIEMIPRPALSQRLIIHEGNLIRLPSGVVDDILKEQHMRKAFIRDRMFQAYFDKELKTAKEQFLLEHITSIQCVSQHKFTNNSMELHCFEITTCTPKHAPTSPLNNSSMSNPNMMMTSTNSGNIKVQRVCHLYGVAKESDRFIWMQKLLEGMTDVFQTGYTCKFYRVGWCYLKNSITSQWAGAWILLQKQKKKLICYNGADMNLEFLDLRKARCLVLKDSDDSIRNLHVESGPMLMIDCPPYSMYMIMSTPRETKIWRHIIKEVAHNNGPSLKEQQLTKDDVPVLVDKCINFVYAHGSMSEGVYRKSGSENSIQKLLTLFRIDAFSVQITRSEYNEHDVANALKRFMRDLPDRLLGKYSASFVSVAEMKVKAEKIVAYKELLMRLPSIEFHTLRKIIGHLNFIHSQKTRNKMGVDNLAIVWGPTLLENKQSQNEIQFSQKEADVVVDLILLYRNLYQLTPDEMAKEKIMLKVLQKYHAAAENLSDSVKQSGDLKVWITIDSNPENEQEEKRQINVTLTPTKTVYDVCKELSPKIKKQAFQVTLNEVILNGDLKRPLHYTEKVFDIVLKWSYWPESDRKNNFLQLQPMKYLKDIERALKNLPIVSPNKELKFADNKTKSFKSYTLELNDGCITVMKKEKSAIIKVRDIDLRRTIAYLGCERKRDFQSRWAITLIENDGVKNILRTRESPYFGHVIAGTNSNDSIVWYSSILHSLYSDDILPNPEMIVLQ